MMQNRNLEVIQWFNSVLPNIPIWVQVFKPLCNNSAVDGVRS